VVELDDGIADRRPPDAAGATETEVVLVIGPGRDVDDLPEDPEEALLSALWAILDGPA
jgi:hypothetical protein